MVTNMRMALRLSIQWDDPQCVEENRIKLTTFLQTLAHEA